MYKDPAKAETMLNLCYKRREQKGIKEWK